MRSGASTSAVETLRSRTAASLSGADVKVLVAMSGGVDSSVAAALLAGDGHDVVGVTMRLWGGESDTGCCSVADVDDARRVAQQLDIDHLVFNFRRRLRRHVVDPYVDAHAGGTTPNPASSATGTIKFDRLLRRADVLGFDAVATGHHARIGRTTEGLHVGGRGADRAKDQSYVVHMLDQRPACARCSPSATCRRRMSRGSPPTSGCARPPSPDSQDVCFITSPGGRRSSSNETARSMRRVVVDTAMASPSGSRRHRAGHDRPAQGPRPARRRPKRYVVDVDRRTSTVVVGDERELLVESTSVEHVTWTGTPRRRRRAAQCSAHGPRAATIVHRRRRST